jgi:hypothetical protein
LTRSVAETQPPVELVADECTQRRADDITARYDKAERRADYLAYPAHAG